MPDMSSLRYHTPNPDLSSLRNSPSTHQSNPQQESTPFCVHSHTRTCDICLGPISPKMPRIRGPPQNPNVGIGHGRKVSEWCANRPEDDLEDVVEEPIKPDNTDQKFHPKKILKPANPKILRSQNRINYEE